MKKFIGIDVGKDGGIAVIDSNNNINLYTIPKIKKEVDERELVRIVKEITKDNCHVVIEDVHSIFGSGAKSNFQFGDINGLIRGIILCQNTPFTKIQPKVWQKEMWQGVKPIEINTGKKTKSGNIKYKIDTKATSLIACKNLFPNTSLKATSRSTKDHDGLIDALLMAEFCRRKFK